MKKIFAGIDAAGCCHYREPRLVNHTENTIRQEIIRKGNVFAKAGTRFG